MNWDAISALAEIVGVVAVVVSLLYLSVQVKQNTNQLRQDNLRNTVRGTLDTNWYYHRDPAAFDVFRRGTKSFDNLSPQEQAHFHSIVVDLGFYVEVVRHMAEAGLIDPSTLEICERFLLSILLTPGGAEWWEMAKRTKPMPQSAIDALQAALDATDANAFPKITDLQPWFGHDDA